MAERKTGFVIRQLTRIPLGLLTLFLLYIVAKSSINLISAYAVPFGFSSGATTAFSTVAVVFFLSLGVLIGLNIFKKDAPD